jgi:light-regulated signal transduction histidine kinase (bacteriophytochrome)
VTPPAPVSGDGAAGRGAVVSHFDITDRKLSEEAMAQRAAELAVMARRLQKTNEELDQFAYVTSHDLRAPLRGIANLSRWIEEDMGDSFPPEATARWNCSAADPTAWRR